MNGLSVQMVFSPQSCSLDWLDKTLTSDLRRLGERISRRIESSIRTGTSDYSLVIGPRGSGKTHLLTYIRKKFQARYANDPSIKIICLSEEERGITSLLDFLVACLRVAGIPAKQVASRIVNTGHPTPLEAALDLFHEVASGKSNLIVVENLSDIFDSLQEEALADLRGFFQENPSVSVFASSVSLFANSSRADHPFYGFFNIHPLKPLNRTVARTYLAILAHAKGDNSLVAALEKDEAQARVNAIYDLTGGNHRLLAMLSTFLSADGLAELVGPFVEMADKELTPYYQQRLDRLTPHQNKLLRAIADHHGRALSVNEIARVTFITPQSVSRQLYDLLHGGYVARNQIGRESCYELAEPLLRLVLDIKEGRDRPLPLIVNLLKNWYSVQVLGELAVMTPEHARFYYDAAVIEKKDLRAEKGVAISSEVFAKQESADEIARAAQDKVLLEGVALAQEGKLDEALTLFDQIISKEPDNPFAWDLHAIRASVLCMSGRYEETLTACDQVVKLVLGTGRPELMRLVATPLLLKGLTLRQLDRRDEEIAVCDDVVKRFGESDRAELQEQVAKALVNKGITLWQLNRGEEVISVYDEVVGRFGESNRPELQEQVATALVNKGVTLWQLNRGEEAIGVYDEVVERFSDSDRPELQEQVAKALVNKGATLGQLNRGEDEIGVYDEVVERFSDSDRPELLDPVAKALVNKGTTLGQLNRGEEAISVYDEVVERFSDSDRPELQEQVANALFNKGVRLGQLNRGEDEIGVYDEVVERFGESDRPELQEQVANALFNKGVKLGQLNRGEEEIGVYDEIVERFGSSDRPELQEQVAMALVNKGVALGISVLPAEALAAFESALRIQPDNPAALGARIEALAYLRREDEALGSLDEMLKRVPEAHWSRVLIVSQLLNVDSFLGDESLVREVIALYKDDKDSLVSGLISWIQNQIPLSRAAAEKLEIAEETLRSAFAQVPEVAYALQMLSAIRRDALGDRKALLSLPVELRRLVESSKEKTV